MSQSKRTLSDFNFGKRPAETEWQRRKRRERDEPSQARPNLPRDDKYALPLYLGNLLAETGRLQPNEVWPFAAAIAPLFPPDTVEGIEEQIANVIRDIRFKEHEHGNE